MLPVIGVTMDTHDRAGYYQLHADYTSGVERAGGLPIAIPYRSAPQLIPQYLDLCDGVLFTGGDDLDPTLFGQMRHDKAAPIDPARQNFELALLAEVEKRRLPTLCICLGCQLLNVHRGGSLHQFLPELEREGAIEHRMLGSEPPRHAINVLGKTLLAEAVGEGQLVANTYHKQAIDRLGQGLRVSARAPDGVIEAIEDPSYPLLLAVQWHPERLGAEKEHMGLFEMLVRAARRT